jgi:hypothetical protein
MLSYYLLSGYFITSRIKEDIVFILSQYETTTTTNNKEIWNKKKFEFYWNSIKMGIKKDHDYNYN